MRDARTIIKGSPSVQYSGSAAMHVSMEKSVTPGVALGVGSLCWVLTRDSRLGLSLRLTLRNPLRLRLTLRNPLRLPLQLDLMWRSG